MVLCPSAVKAELKCYDELGCLETGGAFFDEIRRPFILTPHDRDMIKVQYLLYTRDRPEATMLCWNSSLETVRDSPFNASRPTKFIVHGYLDTVYFGAWMTVSAFWSVSLAPSQSQGFSPVKFWGREGTGRALVLYEVMCANYHA